MILPNISLPFSHGQYLNTGQMSDMEALGIQHPAGRHSELVRGGGFCILQKGSGRLENIFFLF